MKKYEDNTGLFLADKAPVITSIEPKEGKEGTIVKIKGSGFSKYARNNCIVVGGMAACARTQEGTTDTELIVRIDPVSRQSVGDILVWQGVGSNFYNEKILYSNTILHFTETAIFKNGTPVAQAGVEFKLTEVSKNTFGGNLVKGSHPKSNLGGREKEHAITIQIPKSFQAKKFTEIDICLVLKEHPTVAIDFTAKINSTYSTFDLIKAVCKSIMVNGNHIGEHIYADAIINDESGDYEIYVTKPYLEKGLFTIHFK
ncbi:MAG: hypothetical protein JWN83_2039 [Chitinophagaceae bacterium]|nr:hypothetical protein [Chitinophagaceae bacterium]